MHKEQGKHSIIWYEVAGDIIFTTCMIALKIQREIIGNDFIQGKNISRKLCIHENILP